MKMKRIMSLGLAFALSLSLAACGSKEDPKPSTAPGGESDTPVVGSQGGEDKAPLKVLLVSALEGDKAFADSAIAGARKAEKDFNIELSYSQSNDYADYENQILTGAEEGFDLVVASASQWGDAIAAHCAEYPDVMFGITDTNCEGDNVVSVTFAQNQGSFLAGAVAATFTKMTQFPGVNEENIIGWVGGNDIPALRDFFLGFTEGAKYIDPDIQILQSFAGDFHDPLKGKELTNAMFEQGADIVMNVASGTGNGVLEAAELNGLYAIGVDLNQDNDRPGHVLTSMLKENGEGVYQIIKKAVEQGKFTGNERIYMDLEYGGVNLTDMSVMKEHYPDQLEQIEELLALTEELKAKIADGTIVVSNYEGYGKNA